MIILMQFDEAKNTISSFYFINFETLNNMSILSSHAKFSAMKSLI